MTQKIIVTIETDGSIKIAVSGCPGPGCKQLTADLERALGAVTKDTRTAEYHQQAQQQGHAHGQS